MSGERGITQRKWEKYNSKPKIIQINEKFGMQERKVIQSW